VLIRNLWHSCCATELSRLVDTHQWTYCPHLNHDKGRTGETYTPSRACLFSSCLCVCAFLFPGPGSAIFVHNSQGWWCAVRYCCVLNSGRPLVATSSMMCSLSKDRRKSRLLCFQCSCSPHVAVLRFVALMWRLVWCECSARTAFTCTQCWEKRNGTGACFSSRTNNELLSY
jgi:hypothetical protein